MTTYPSLFEPLQLGPVEVPNRLAAAFTGVAWGADNLPSPIAQMAVAERAGDGTGLIIGEPQCVHPAGTGSGSVVENTADRVVEPCAALARIAHAAGARLFGRLWHPGILGNPGFRSVPLWGPSPVRATLGGTFPLGGGDIAHEMTIAEIGDFVSSMGAAAGRLRVAGYDGVEVDAAHGSLIAQFIHPSTNHRADAYGGSPENRLRLLTDVLAAVRAAIGDGLALGVRLSPDGFAAGNGQDAWRSAAVAAAGAGAHYLSLGPETVPDRFADEAYLAIEARDVGAAAGLPVLYRGKVTSPETAAALIDRGDAALVSIFQAGLADPGFVSAIRNGEGRPVRPCISCNETCAGSSSDPPPHCVFRCLPALQGLASLQPAPSPRKVTVVGAGIAGLEASALLAEQGHTVTLLECQADIGGQLQLAARLPGGGPFAALVEYYRQRLQSAGVVVRTDVDVTVATVADDAPDLVIVATGAREEPVILDSGDELPGIAAAVNANGDVGKRVVLALGPTEKGRQSLQLAELLLARGHDVELAFPSPVLLPDAGHDERLAAYRRLAAHGVRLHPDSELVDVRDGQAAIRNVFNQRVSTLDCDTVVAAYGRSANESLFLEIERAGLPVHQVGDCVSSRDIKAAIRDVQMLVVKLAQQGEWTK